jgi:tetratricopeptide (TPR) repeat protein
MKLTARLRNAYRALTTRTYDAAGASGRWPAAATMPAPVGEALAARGTLAMRAQYLAENSPYGQAAVSAWIDHLIADGPSLRHPDRRIVTAWNCWWNEADAEGLGDLGLLRRRAARSLAVDGGDILNELFARSSLATIAADAGDAVQALPHLQRCRQIVAAGENWFGLAGSVERAEAVVAAAQREYAVAETHFEKAAAIFQRYCRPWEEADTLQYGGRALLAAGERARAMEKFDGAIEIYRSRDAGTPFIDYVMVDKGSAEVSKSTHT